jgi:hypothetical protein
MLSSKQSHVTSKLSDGVNLGYIQNISLKLTNKCTQLSQVHINIFKNTTLLHVSDLTGQSSGVY